MHIELINTKSETVKDISYDSIIFKDQWMRSWMGLSC